MMFEGSFRTAGFVMALGAGCLTACGAADGSDSGQLEASTEQAVIAGAAVVRKSQVFSVPGNGTASFTNNCTSGVAVGGGYLSQNPNMRGITSRPSGNGWTVTASNRSAGALNMNSEVECLTGTNATRTQGSSSTVTLRGNSVNCATATCPSGSFAVAGGWTGSASVAPYISERGLNGTSWNICAKNSDFFQSGTFQAFVTCLQGVSGSASAATSLSTTLSANSTQRIDSPPCATGLLLGSGGFRLTSGGVQALPTASSRSFQEPTKWSAFVLNTDQSLSLDVTVSGICLNLSR
jgi:hypothetical protein